MTILIRLFKLSLKIIYVFLKLLKTNNKKIVFISRQSNDVPLDFKLIKEEVLKRNKDIKMVFICKVVKKGVKNYIKFYFTTIRQMYHLATSKICIIDSYCIPVCILKHKASLTVLQIWHSNGKIKKSGYQTLNMESGRNKKIANLMCMHKNYDAIIAGGKAFNRFYKAGFNVKEKVLLNYGLPRVDYLINSEEKNKKRILEKYPEFKNKKVILYVPTFRTYEIDIKDLINNYDRSKCVLIIKPHPKQDIKINDKDIYYCNEFSSFELLSVADYVITDYSSICLDAAIINKKVLFYLYDYEIYIKKNGLNFDPIKNIKGCSFKTIEPILDIIANNKYDNKSYQIFRKKYLPPKLGCATKLIGDYIFDKLK